MGFFNIIIIHLQTRMLLMFVGQALSKTARKKIRLISKSDYTFWYCLFTSWHFGAWCEMHCKSWWEDYSHGLASIRNPPKISYYYAKVVPVADTTRCLLLSLHNDNMEFFKNMLKLDVWHLYSKNLVMCRLTEENLGFRTHFFDWNWEQINRALRFLLARCDADTRC